MSSSNAEQKAKIAETNSHFEEGIRILLAESAVLAETAKSLDPIAFEKAVNLILNSKSHVVVIGIGKSGHVGKKISATFASTGTPAFFVHPAEALHGDLGMMTSDNVIVALSNSGTSEELLNLLPYIHQHDIPLIVITSVSDSKLANAADVVLTYPLDHEACPLNLAPTASTAAQMALGDALMGALMKARGFTNDDFAVRHPLGALGRRLLMKVSELMLTKDKSPIISEDALFNDAIDQMTGMGAVVLVNGDGKLAGIFTNEDMRRMIREGKTMDPSTPMSAIMTKNPRHIRADILASKAIENFEVPKRVSVLPVIDKDKTVVGMLHLHHLIQAGMA